MVEETVHASESRQVGRDGVFKPEAGVKSAPREMLARGPRSSSHSDVKNRLWRYGPVVLWALAIFIFSSGLFSGSNTSSVLKPLVLWVYPNVSDTGLAFFHGLIRKSMHFAEYAVLALLTARALRTSSTDFLRNHWFAVALGFVALYALSDEFHQSFVPTRTASIYDCLIDTAGGLAALLVTTLRYKRRRHGD